MRRSWMIGAVMVAVGVTAMPLPGSASAELPAFRAIALAEGGRLTFTVPGFAVVEDFIDGGGPVSQAAVDGQSASSFASLPYPGETALAFPGLFAAVAGQPLPAGYPFFVTASHPTTPEQELKDPSGAYELSTKAAAGSASGLAQLRGQGGEGQNTGSGGTQATTSVRVDGDTVNVVAETVNEALNVGAGALRIASVRSRSVTTYRAGEQNPVTKAELTIDGGSAGDTKFSFGPGGLVVAGTAVPIPAGSGVEHLNQALAPAGVSIRFLEPEQLVGGVSAGAFEVTLTEKSPASGVPGGKVRVRFGGATTALALGSALPVDAGAVTEVGAATGAVPSSGPETSAPAAVPATAPPVSGEVPASLNDDSVGPEFAAGPALSRSASAYGSAPETGVGDAVAAAALPVGESATNVAPVAATSVAPRPIGADGFVFGSLIVAGLLMMILSSLWRAKGVLH